MFWNNFSWVWLLIICITMSSIISTWIRARYGEPRQNDNAHGGGRHDRGWGDSFGAEAFGSGGEAPRRFAEELEARDKKIAALEERVRVLERIVTDRSSSLKDEIDRLAG